MSPIKFPWEDQMHHKPPPEAAIKEHINPFHSGGFSQTY